MAIHEILADLLSAPAGEERLAEGRLVEGRFGKGCVGEGRLGKECLGERPRVDDIVAALGPRSFGIVLVLFGLPNLLPVPGLPILCGCIIGIIAFQMVLGKEHLLLPGWVGQRRLKREDLARVVQRAAPTLSRVERLMRPRLTMLATPGMSRLTGLVLLVLALALMAPIPFFGGIAPGFAVILLGLGLAERDGLVLMIGTCASGLAVLITLALTLAILKSLAILVL